MPSEALHHRVMREFAEALVARDFERAATLLAPELASEYPPSVIEETFDRMVDYGEGPPTEAVLAGQELDVGEPAPGTSGWSYVAILGPGYGEAVSGIVDLSGRISELEWGRP